MKCFYCKKEFEVDKGYPISKLPKVKIGEDNFICCPKCEFEKIGKPTMNIKDLDKAIIKEFLEEGTKNGCGDLSIMISTLKHLLSQSNQEIVKEILDRVDKEVIGADEDPNKVLYELPPIHRNNFREEQRQKLTQLRQSNKL